MLSDERFQNSLAQGREALKPARLVLAHEASVADHVSGKDGGKPAFHTLSPSIRRLAVKDGRIYAAEQNLNVRVWLQADMQPPEIDFCFAPESGHWQGNSRPNHKALHFSRPNTTKGVTS